jgi:class 3 adenylate cyclase/tetratricopeptide (TPR) repeat protein
MTRRYDVAVQRLLDDAAAALDGGDWRTAAGLAEAALALAPDSDDAMQLLRRTQSYGSPRQREEGTRRRLTVMFCDLVESTSLASRLDPEETRELLRAYQQVCAAAIARYDGHVAHVMGDGLLVYFGHPRAHEDDPLRAALAGLAIVEGVGEFRVYGRDDVQLAARVGIHTGLSVIADMGVGSWTLADDVVGETPNLAARITSEAQPNAVVISEETMALVQGRVACTPLGPKNLKGISRPIELYEVISELAVDSRFEAAARAQGRLVGRTEEIGAIEEAWQQARGGLQGLVLVGEPGIGKSRLVAHAKSHVETHGGGHITLQCSAHHQGSPLHPVIRRWQRELDLQQADGEPFDRLQAVAAGFGLDDRETLFLLATLLSIPWPGPPPLTAPPEQLRERTFAALVSWVDQLAARKPLLVVVEDLHWADPSTWELLVRIVDRSSTAPVLAMVTSREPPPGSLGPRCRLLELGPLATADCAEIVDDLSVHVRLPAATRHLIVERSDGVPLYVEELTRMLSDPRRHPGADPSDVTVPHTLHDLLVARLDTFPDERELAQTIATIGQPASWNLLQRLVNADEPELARQLEVLVGAQLLRVTSRDRPAYEFGHALVRDAAYGLQLRTHRRELHARVATALAEEFRISGEEHPEVLAYHFENAGDFPAAAGHWLQAARRHATVAAHVEAIEHYRRSLDVATRGPSPGPHFELEARGGLASSLLAARGYTSEEVAEAYGQLRDLSGEWSGRRHHLESLYGLWAYYHVRGQNTVSLELAERMMAAASRSGTPADGQAAAAVLGYQHLYMGRPVPARRLLERARHWSAPDDACPFPHHPGVGATVNLALALWILGHSAAARAAVAEAVAAAEALAGPVAEFTRAYTHTFAAGLFHAADDPVPAAEHATRAMQISGEHGFASWLGAGMINLAVANALTGEPSVSIPVIEFGLSAWREAGAESNRTQFLLGLAMAHRRAGRPDTALATVDEALAQVEATEERFVEADLLRLRGELLAEEGGDHEAALAALDAAVAVARHQQARAVELKALTSRHAVLHRLGLSSDLTDLRRLLESFDQGEVVEPYVVAAREAAGTTEVPR